MRRVLTICGWCDTRVRDVEGRWNAGRAEPGRRYSHGVCPTCAEAMLLELDDDLPARPQVRPG